MFNSFFKNLKSYWKIIKCHYSGKHRIEVVNLGGQRLRGCRECDLWRYLSK